MDDQNEGHNATGHSLWPLVCLSLVVVGIWAAAGLVVYLSLPSWNDRGTFGDMFGAVNALFSSLAFAGIIYTILIQRRELALSLLEFRRTADAQEKARVASLLIEVYDFMYALRPQWLRLYELSSTQPDWRKWTKEDQQLGEEIATQLQRIAYFCEKGLLDPVLVRDNWGIVFVKCWDILHDQIDDYRRRWTPHKQPYEPRPPRSDFQSIAAQFRTYYEKQVDSAVPNPPLQPTGFTGG